MGQVVGGVSPLSSAWVGEGEGPLPSVWVLEGHARPLQAWNGVGLGFPPLRRMWSSLTWRGIGCVESLGTPAVARRAQELGRLTWTWVGQALGRLVVAWRVQELGRLPPACLGQVAGPPAVTGGVQELGNPLWACVEKTSGLSALAWEVLLSPLPRRRGNV